MEYLDQLEMKWDAIKMILILPLIILPIFTILVTGLFFSYMITCDERFDEDKYSQCMNLIYNIWVTPLITLLISSFSGIGFYFGVRRYYLKEIEKQKGISVADEK